MAEYLSPWEIANYQNRNDQLGTNYQNQLASSAYQRARLGLRNNMALDQIGQSFDRQRALLPGSFIQRGLYGNSGIFNSALEDYAKARGQAFSNQQFNYSDQLGQLDLQDQQAGSTYNTGLAGVAAEQAARRAELATQLRGII